MVEVGGVIWFCSVARSLSQRVTTVLIKSASPSFLVQDVLSECLCLSYKGFLLCSILLYMLLVTLNLSERGIFAVSV